MATVPDPRRPRRRSGRVEATGLCRSDWHGWMGHDPDIALPHVPGHELAGVIEAVGPEVARWARRARHRPVRVRLRHAASSAAPATSRSATASPSRASRTGARSPSSSRSTGPTSTWSRCPTPSTSSPRPRSAAASPPPTAPSRRARVAAGRVGGRARLRRGRAVGGDDRRALGARVVGVDVSDGRLAAARQRARRSRCDRRRHPRPSGGTAGGAHVSIDAIGAEPAVAASVAGLRKRGRHVQVGLLLPTRRACRWTS